MRTIIKAIIAILILSSSSFAFGGGWGTGGGDTTANGDNVWTGTNDFTDGSPTMGPLDFTDDGTHPDNVTNGLHIYNGEWWQTIAGGHSVLSLGSAIRYQETDPDATDDDGLYINTTDNKVSAVQNGFGVRSWTSTFTPAIPEYLSGTMLAVGNSLETEWNVPITKGSAWAETLFTATGSTTGESSLILASGDTTKEWKFTSAKTFVEDETIEFDFTGLADAVENADGGDLAAIVDGDVTNNSTQSSCSGTGTLGFTGTVTGTNSNKAIRKLITATSDICASSGTIDVSANFTASQHLRVIVWDSSGVNVIATSSEVTGDGTAGDKTFTFTQFQISSGTEYSIGMVGDDSTDWNYATGTTSYYYNNEYAAYPTATGISWTLGSALRNPLIEITND